MSPPAEQPGEDWAPAWVLSFPGGRRAAVAEHELQEVLVRPDCRPPAPGSPSVCVGRLSWRGLELPLIDPGIAFGLRNAPSVGWVTIAAYRDAATAPLRYAALCLSAAPILTRVSDTMACGPPDDSLGEHLIWSFLGLSFFRDGEQVVPVLALERLFSEAGQRRLDRFCSSGSGLQAGDQAQEPCP